MTSATDDRKDIFIRNLDPRLYHQLRIEALRRSVPVAALVNEAIREWLANRAVRDPESRNA